MYKSFNKYGLHGQRGLKNLPKLQPLGLWDLSSCGYTRIMSFFALLRQLLHNNILNNTTELTHRARADAGAGSRHWLRRFWKIIPFISMLPHLWIMIVYKINKYQDHCTLGKRRTGHGVLPDHPPVIRTKVLVSRSPGCWRKMSSSVIRPVSVDEMIHEFEQGVVTWLMRRRFPVVCQHKDQTLLNMRRRSYQSCCRVYLLSVFTDSR